jgi:hypothetical protein
LDTGVDYIVYALTVFADGTGPALYVGGSFTMAGAVEANYIAKWDGTSWSPVGEGMNGQVFALAVWNDGTGEALYAGGMFTAAGGVPANHIAKWDGLAWSALGSGTDDRVYTIAGTERPSVLFARGNFTVAGRITVNNVAAWDGAAWPELGTGTDDWVRTLTVVDDIDGTSPMLALDPAFQFDFSTLTDNGVTYMQVPDLPVLRVLYFSQEPVEGTIFYLPAYGSLRIGSLGVVLPTGPGSYILDVANAGQDGRSPGALVMFGFGPEVDEPFTTWRATTAELTGGAYTFDVLAALPCDDTGPELPYYTCPATGEDIPQPPGTYGPYAIDCRVWYCDGDGDCMEHIPTGPSSDGTFIKYGDVNDDGSVNSKDLSCLQMWAATGGNVPAGFQACDKGGPGGLVVGFEYIDFAPCRDAKNPNGRGDGALTPTESAHVQFVAAGIQSPAGDCYYCGGNQ